MSGVIIQCCAKTRFEYNDVAASGSQSQWIARQVDVSQWRDIVVGVRVFDMTITETDASIDVEVYNDGRTADEPGQILWQTSSVGTVSLTNQSAGSYQFHLADLDDYPVGGTLTVVVTGTQGASQNTVEADLAIELVCKS